MGQYDVLIVNGIPVRLFWSGEEIATEPSFVTVDNPAPMSPVSSVRGDARSGGSRDFLSQFSLSGLSEPCAAGSIVEVVINAQGSPEGVVVVEAHSPSGRILRCPVSQRGSAYTATFTPIEVGDWRIAIFYDNEHIRGSPFSAYVYDANLVQVYGLDVGIVGQELKFNVDCGAAGRGDVKVNVLHHGHSLPADIEKQGPGLYRVHFTPDGPGQYKIHIYFNNMEVKGSPFILDIVDASSVSVYGENLKMASIERLSTFMIHAVGADMKDLTVTILAPSGKKKRARVIPMGDSTYRVEWKPVEVGEHYLDVRLYNQSVHDSPFTCNVGDPDLISLRNLPALLRHTDLGELQSFEIDASAAGSGNLEIMINGGRVPCRVKELGGRCYLATFVPNQPVTHVIDLRFNGEPVKGSPWRVEMSLPDPAMGASGQVGASYVLQPVSIAQLPSPVGGNYFLSASSLQNLSTTQVQSMNASHMSTSNIHEVSREVTEMPIHIDLLGNGLKEACVGKVASFEVGGRSFQSDDVEVKITSPTGKYVPCKIIAARTGNYRCEYVPTEVGTYFVDVKVQKQTVSGSPFKVLTYAPQKVYIDPIPGGSVGKPCQFFVDANEAGKGDLEISINQGRIPYNVQMQGSGRCLVTFIPEDSGTYIIEVTFNKELVRGCPIRVEIHASKSAESNVIRSTSQSMVSESSGQRSTMLNGRVGGKTTTNYSYKEYSSGGNTDSGITSPENRAFGDFNGTAKPFGSAFVKKETTITPDRDQDVQFADMLKPSYFKERRFETLTDATNFQSEREQTSVASRAYLSKIGKDQVDSVPPPPPPGDSRFPPPPYLEETDKDRNEIYMEGPGLKATDSFISGKQPQKTEVMFESLKTSSTSRPETSYTSTARFTVPGQSERVEKIMPSKAPSKAKEPESPLAPREPLPKTSAMRQWGKYEEETRIESRVDKEPDAPLYSIPKKDRMEESSFASASRVREDAARFEKRDYPKEDRQQNKYGGETVARYGMPEQSRIMDRYQGAEPVGADSTDSPMILEDRSFEARRRVSAEAVKSEQRDSETTRAIGPALEGVPLRKPTYLELKPLSVPTKSVDVKVVGPNGKQVDADVDRLAGGYRIGFTPTAIGVYETYVSIEGKEMRGSPFATTVFALDQVMISQQHTGIVGETIDFSVDTSKAGGGDISATVKDGQGLPVPVKSRTKDPIHHFSFVPLNAGRYLATVKLNDHPIEESPLRFEIDPNPSSVAWVETETFPDQVQNGSWATFRLHGKSKEKLNVNVTDPDGRRVPAVMKEGNSGEFNVEFQPKGLGAHKIQVLYAGQELVGSPFTCQVYDAKNIRVTHGRFGIVGSPVHLIVNATEAGVGNLEVSVNNGDTPTIAQDLGNHEYDISFVPEGARDHSIEIRFNDNPVPGSPFHCKIISPEDITCSGPGRDRVPVGLPATLRLEVPHVGKGIMLETDKISAAIRDPQKNIMKGKVNKSLDDDSYEITYTPQLVGGHSIDVSYAGTPIGGSPFTAKAYDAKAVKVYGIKDGVLGEKNSFNIDASNAGAGNLEIVVSVNGENVKNNVKNKEKAKFDVHFTPEVPAPHLIKVSFNDELVPGCPFQCNIRDTKAMVDFGFDLKRVPAKRPAQFTIDTRGVSGRECNVDITAPSQSKLPAKLRDEDDCTIVAEFNPLEVGPHVIRVSYDGKDLLTVPYRCDVYDPTQVKVSKIGPAFVNRAVRFEIDTSLAGEGDIAVEVKNHSTLVPCHIVPLDMGSRLEASFLPIDPAPHSVHVTFNEQPVKGTPFVCEVLNNIEATPKGDALKFAQIGKMNSFTVETAHRLGDEELIVKITDPQREHLQPKMERLSDKVMEVSYSPKRLGAHMIEVSVAGQGVAGSPFTSEAFDISAIRVAGLKDGFVGKEQKVQVLHEGAGKGYLDVDILHEGKRVHSSLQSVEENAAVVSFVPKQAGVHRVKLVFNGFPVPGSPFDCQIYDASRVEASGAALRTAIANMRAHFSVDAKIGNAGDENELDVTITGPAGDMVPVKCFQQPTGNFRVEFTPHRVGKHKVDVTYGDVAVAGSPFTCEVYDPTQLAFNMDGLDTALPGQQAFFTVDQRSAGAADLKLKVIDPEGKELKHSLVANPDGALDVKFTPTTVGKYVVKGSFGDADIQKSTFNVLPPPPVAVPAPALVEPPVVTKERSYENREEARAQGASPAAAERGKAEPSAAAAATAEKEKKKNEVPPGGGYITASGSGLKYGLLNVKSSFIIDGSKGAPNSNIQINVYGPEGDVKTEYHNKGESRYEVTYIPKAAGSHRVVITYNGKQVSGSPFEVEVLDPTAVVLVDPPRDSEGRVAFRVGKETHLDIDTSAAGKDELACEIRGPTGKQPLQTTATQGGRYVVTTTPEHEGNYYIYLYYGGTPVPSTPISAYAKGSPKAVVQPSTSGMGFTTKEKKREVAHDGGEVMLSGEGIRQAKTNCETEFLIDGSMTEPGKPECEMRGERADIPVKVVPLGNNVFTATYTALYPGDYSLHVDWNGRPVRGSPFKVRAAPGADASKVVVPESVKSGILGKEMKEIIDVSKAGPGELSAKCMGPNNRPAYCEVYQNKNGTFTLNVKPDETGKHTLIIKYGSEHVPGSPYALYISSPPDPSKVKVSGPGIEHGILSKFRSNFVVDTKGAGAGQLTVRVRGPKGAFNVEMQRESKSDRAIHCRYDPKEPGDYQVEVRWAGEHVPGSPFNVMIVDTQQELERVRAGQPAQMGHPPPNFPPGWTGPPPPGLAMHPPPPRGPLPPPGPPHFPPRGVPYANSTIHSTASSKHWVPAQGDF